VQYGVSYFVPLLFYNYWTYMFNILYMSFLALYVCFLLCVFCAFLLFKYTLSPFVHSCLFPIYVPQPPG
jgi:ABC-type phosphate/phosphonate transport system permease subunit